MNTIRYIHWSDGQVMSIGSGSSIDDVAKAIDPCCEQLLDGSFYVDHGRHECPCMESEDED